MICECCGKEHDGTFGSGRFCSKSCANKRTFSLEQKNNISLGMRKFYNKQLELINKKQNKQLCKFCGNLQINCKNPLCKQHQSRNWYKNLIPFGFNYKTLGTEKYIAEHDKVKELLYNEYINNGCSPKEIYELYNCKQYFASSETLLHIFKKWEFPIRNYSLAAQNALKNNRLFIPINKQFHTERHITWNNKIYFLKNSYEKEFADLLDKQCIDYIVEFKHIKYYDTVQKKYRIAIPDFYIPKTNTIIEIKSNYTLDIQNMKDKFEAYKKLDYNSKLILDHKEVNLNTL